MFIRPALLIFILGALVPGTSRAEPCWRPTNPIKQLDGDHAENDLAFGYLSSLYRWRGDFRFYRCVEDRASIPFAVDWKHLDLNTTIEADSNAYTDFPSRNDDKVVERSSLYFGAAPDKVRPDAVFKPDEAQENSEAGFTPREGLPVLLAQFDGIPSLSEALTSPRAFEAQVARLREINGEGAVFRSLSYARVFLPVDEEDHALLRTEGGLDDLSGSGFFAIEIAIGETYALNDNLLEIQPQLTIQVPPEDMQRFSLSRYRPSISFEGSGREFLGGTLDVPEQVVLEGPILSWERKQLTKSFPIERVEQELTIRIGEFAMVTLPILVTPPG